MHGAGLLRLWGQPWARANCSVLTTNQGCWPCAAIRDPQWRWGAPSLRCMGPRANSRKIPGPLGWAGVQTGLHQPLAATTGAVAAPLHGHAPAISVTKAAPCLQMFENTNLHGGSTFRREMAKQKMPKILRTFVCLVSSHSARGSCQPAANTPHGVCLGSTGPGTG